MKNFNTLRRTFVRQSLPNDCGIACLRMILNYAGEAAEADLLSRENIISVDGLSLLDIHKLANKYGVKSQCVKMEMGYLETINHPVILHVINRNDENHFIVCYGLSKENENYFIIGDPARQMSLILRSDLELIWQSKAAIYFGELNFKDRSFREVFNMPYENRLAYPLAVWLALPLLNILAAVLGVVLSWAIQKGTDAFLTGNNENLLTAVPLLLLILMAFRSMINYVRQLVLIKFNNSICENYLNLFIRRITQKPDNTAFPGDEQLMRSRMADVQKIQNGLSNLAAVLLSEGALITLILSAVFYLDLPSGLINLAGILILLTITAMNSSFYSSNLAYLNDLSAHTETSLVNELNNFEPPENAGLRVKKHQENYLNYLAQAKKIGLRLGRVALLSEWTGTVVTLLVFCRCLSKVRSVEMPNATLVLLVISSYFITSLMQKICSAWNVIAEGRDANRLFSAATR